MRRRRGFVLLMVPVWLGLVSCSQPGLEDQAEPPATSELESPDFQLPEEPKDERVTVPNVEGRKLARARDTLRDRGLQVEVSKQASSKPVGTVIGQTPLPGSKRQAGATVQLIVAKPKPEPPDDVENGTDCQGYMPCIPPGPDVDCAGGTGDGPRYVDGPVTVTGSDPYGLDGDGDGTGCES
jgi:hypothetical protein